MDLPRAGSYNLVLTIDGLSVGYRTPSGWRRAVRNVSLELHAGQTYGLVGESGSGKTTLALAVMNYLPRTARILEGRILFAGRDLAELTVDEMRRIWGSQIALGAPGPLVVAQSCLADWRPALRTGAGPPGNERPPGPAACP